MADNSQHIKMIQAAWDAYHDDYMQFHLKEWPAFHEHFSRGGTILEPCIVEALGDVRGLSLLDVCCACDAKQAFSWANLGARVMACDLSPEAIRIARDNAARIGAKVDFAVADAQTLDPIADGSFDIVFATYLCWFENISLACRNWHRVLRPSGRLLMHFHHPLTSCLEVKDGVLTQQRSYFDTTPDHSDFVGTDIADRHGGWGKRMACVEFHHTLGEIAEAALSAGFRLLRMSEHAVSTDPILSKLPSHVLLLWAK